MMNEKNFETRAIRQQNERTRKREHSVPLYLTSSFVFDSAEQAEALFDGQIKGNIYSRYSNPNTDEFVAKMVDLEHCEDGVAFATGMAAVFASLAGLLNSGDHVVASNSLFGSSLHILHKILPRWNISTTFVAPDDPDQWQRAVRPETRMLFVETPSNPGLRLADLEFLGALAREMNLILNIDNCFATPYLQNPVDFGAHLVSHSATKFIDGQGRVLGGLVAGKASLIDEIRFFARQTGPALSPFNAWVLSKSLETLAVRMDRHCDNAEKLAHFLSSHPKVKSVAYPFLASHPQFALAQKQMKRGGGLVTFEVKDGADQARQVVNQVQMISRSSNLGDSRTIITHPATTTHAKQTPEEREQAGIFDGTLRVSVGLEDINDIIDDLDQALGMGEHSV